MALLVRDRSEEPQTVCGIAADIKGSKRAERALLESETRFRIFFERSADAMSLLAPQTLRFIKANEVVVQLLGAPDRETLCRASPMKSSSKQTMHLFDGMAYIVKYYRSRHKRAGHMGEF